ncbi:MAG: cytochrome c oxidase subunit II [Gammaproteobacteria bacterium]|nr:cytochrome c oxidase subunit II [Gammaproteobacteria bacterium]
MRVALLILAVVVGSVIFNFTTPFHLGQIASNWGLIDVTIWITFVLCGLAFIILGILMAWWIYKYQYQPGQLAEYEPEDPVLEGRLTILTTIGVVVMLAPGLIAWNDYIAVPEDAIELEVFSEQWTWSFRLPGEDGIFGYAHNKNIDIIANPMGIRDDDPYAQDDLVIETNIVKVPVDKKIKVLLRSKDVLHDFWVPEIRAKMDSVPGMVTYFWFEPTRTGVFEILCAELCGSSHHAMRGEMHIVTREEYQLWLDDQITWAERKAGVVPLTPVQQLGQTVARDNGCFACHNTTGAAGTPGPTWKGMWGTEVELDDGSIVTRDEAYVRESITNPGAKLVKGFSNTMLQLSDDVTTEDIDALIEYLKTTTPAVEETDSPLETIEEPVDESES